MRLRKLIRRTAVVTAAAVALVMSVSSPALAAQDWTYGVFFGDGAKSTQFAYGVASSIYPGGFDNLPRYTYSEARLLLGHNATVSATDCRISIWQTLDKAGSDTWETPHVSSNCMDAIRERDRWQIYSAGPWGTSATAARGSMCVYLYYNHSSTYGWARCQTGEWVYI